MSHNSNHVDLEFCTIDNFGPVTVNNTVPTGLLYGTEYSSFAPSGSTESTSNLHPRAVRLQITPTFPWLEENPYSGLPGQFRLCTADMSISGYAGQWQYAWINNDITSTSNPLRWTDYDPVSGVNASILNNLLTYEPSNIGDLWLFCYKVFTEEDTKNYGHQLFGDQYNPDWVGGGTNNWLAETLLSPEGTAAYEWDSRVDKVVMIDTMPKVNIWDTYTSSQVTCGQQGNQVQVFVIFKDGLFWEPDGDELVFSAATVKVDLDGDCRFIKSSGSSMPPPSGHGHEEFMRRIIQPPGLIRPNGSAVVDDIIVSNIRVKHKELSQDEVLDIKPLAGWHREEPLLDNKQLLDNIGYEIVDLDGVSVAGKPRKIARIKITSPSKKYFVKKPKLVTNHNLVLKTIKTVSSNEDRNIKAIDSYVKTRRTEYEFYIVYNGARQVSNKKILDCELTWELADNYSQRDGIQRVDCGNHMVSKDGDHRDIIIYGNPGAEFGISIDKVVLEDIGDDITGSQHVIVGSETKSILVGIKKGDEFLEAVSGTGRRRQIKLLGRNNSARLLDTFIDDNGLESNFFKGIIPSNGRYRLKQFFSSSVVQRTKVNGGKSTTTAYQFDDASKVRVGDTFKSPQLQRKNNHWLNTLPEVASVNPNGVDLVFDTEMTLSDNKDAQFERGTIWRVKLLEEWTPVISSNCATEHILRQAYETRLTINYTIGAHYKILKYLGQNALKLSGAAYSAGDDFSIYYSDVINTKKRWSDDTHELTLKLDNGAHNWTGTTIPKFSMTTENSDYVVGELKANGFHIMLYSFKFGDVGANEIKFSYKLKVVKWGHENSTITLPLDNFLTHA